MGWNGLDFVDELSTKLGDQTQAFKNKVVIWTNDGIKEIASRHTWDFTRELGKKVLTANQSTQDVSLGQPTAVTLAQSGSGATLTAGNYEVAVSFYEGASENESMIGVVSNTITVSDDKQLDLTGIPVSSDPLVTARRVYMRVDTGPWKFIGTISNNTTTTYTITADADTYAYEAHDEHSIRSFDGNPFIDSTNVLEYKVLDQIILEINGVTSSGTPRWWAQAQDEKIYMHPKPSSALTLSYYYFKIPRKMYYHRDSKIFIPEWLKPDLERYVMWRGYEYRDRDGQESKFNNFEQKMQDTISKKGSQRKVARRIRDSIGDSDGWPI